MRFPNSAKEVERLVHESIEELKELERLAKIGDAFEKAKNEKFEFIQYTPYAGARTEYYPIEDEEYSKVIEWASR